MFRDGGSEYAINGTPCRLLDVQELLSDSGIGREMHVIVGQGQLDAVLHATPEERRGFIEEAAGVLKHRKRKEKALRKLEAMEANLTRLSDLTSEIRRQLRPLGRQAEVARRAGVVQADVRDARLRLLADDLVAAARRRSSRRTPTRRRSRAPADAVEAELRTLRPARRSSRPRRRRPRPALHRAQDTWYRLSGSARAAAAPPRAWPSERLRLLAEEPTGTDARGATRRSSRPRPSTAAGQERELAEATRAAQAAVARRPSPHGRPRRRTPRSRPPSPAASGPRPTGARGWPGWPGRWPRGAAGSRPREAEIGRLRGVLAEAEQRGRGGRVEFAAWSPRSPARSRGRRAWTPSTSGPPQSSRRPRPRSRRWWSRSARPSGTGRPGPPATRRSRSAWPARTARGRCWPPATA